MKTVSILAMLLVGCSINPKPPAEHDFGSSKPLLSQRLVDAQSISVDAPKWIWDKGIRYRLLYKNPTQISSYALDTWVAPPPELFGHLLRASAKNTGYSLAINLLEFEQQFLAPNQAKVVLRFNVDAVTDDQRKHVSQEFYLEQATMSADAAGAVNGFANLTRQAMDRIFEWLGRQ